MVAKISPRHRAAFIEALAETGNITLAAAQVKVSRQWAKMLRRRDPEFDAACRQAIERARERLVLRDSPSTSSGLPQDERSGRKIGAGFVINRGNGILVQVRRARPRQWTEDTEKRFLLALAGSCNVKLSAAEVGTSKAAAYYHRRHYPAFAAAWDEAIHAGYARLEAALVESAINFFDGDEASDGPIRGMTVADAIHLLYLHRQEARGIGGRPGGRPRVATDEEVRKALARSLRAFGVTVTKEDMQGD